MQCTITHAAVERKDKMSMGNVYVAMSLSPEPAQASQDTQEMQGVAVKVTMPFNALVHTRKHSINESATLMCHNTSHYICSVCPKNK